MKVTSIAGAARNARLQMLTQISAGATTNAPPMARPAAMAPPPPRASSFGGADPRAMFEALVQGFDRDGDGSLSLGEVNALDQGGLLSRSFGRVDSNGDGHMNSDEIAAAAPWSSSLPAAGDQGGGEQGADVRPLFDRLPDRMNNNRDAALIADDLAAIRRAEAAPRFDTVQTGAKALADAAALTPQTSAALTGSSDPATLMESMVMARSSLGPDDAEGSQTRPARHAYTLR